MIILIILFPTNLAKYVWVYLYNSVADEHATILIVVSCRCNEQTHTKALM